MAKLACSCGRTFRTTRGRTWHKQNTCEGATAAPKSKKARKPRKPRTAAPRTRSSPKRMTQKQANAWMAAGKRFPHAAVLEIAFYFREDAKKRPPKKYNLRTTRDPYGTGKVTWYGVQMPLKGMTPAEVHDAFDAVKKKLRMSTADIYLEDIQPTRRSKDGLPLYICGTGT